jgi:hypothetical protein
MPRFAWVLLLASLVAAPARAQSASGEELVGTWKFDLKQGDKKMGPRTVVVRPDSSASYGKETVRWRIKPDSLLLALGGEWVSYRLKLKGKQMVLSGGDLTEAVSFDKIGPPTPRPDSVPVPPDPDQQPS